MWCVAKRHHTEGTRRFLSISSVVHGANDDVCIQLCYERVFCRAYQSSCCLDGRSGDGNKSSCNISVAPQQQQHIRISVDYYLNTTSTLSSWVQKTDPRASPHRRFPPALHNETSQERTEVYVCHNHYLLTYITPLTNNWNVYVPIMCMHYEYCTQAATLERAKTPDRQRGFHPTNSGTKTPALLPFK